MTPRRAMALVIGLPLAAVLALWAWHVAEARRPVDVRPATTWTVRPNQTIWRYARDHYPDRDPREIVERIRAANGGVDPGRLRPGRVLIVPEIGR